MVIILPVILCLLPLILTVVIFRFGSKLKLTQILLACLLGLLAILPISLVQYWLPLIPFFQRPAVINSLLRSIVVYGLIEELFKMVLIMPIPKRENTLLEYFFLSLVFGLSLGCFETIIYFLDHIQKANINGGQLLYLPIFQRIVSSDCIHTMCAGLLGFFVFEAKEKRYHFQLIIWAVCLHGLYDFFAGFQNSFRYFAIAVVLFSVIECRVRYLKIKS